MPSTIRRRLLETTAAGLVVGVAGCLGGGSDRTDDTERDHLVVENGTETEREVSVVVADGGEHILGGRYRLPGGAAARTDEGVPWGRYEVAAKLHDDIADWQSWTWHPRSCAEVTATDADPDGRVTATLAMGSDRCRFSVEGCDREMPGGAFGGGGGRDDPRTPLAEYRVGDPDTPPE